VADAFVRRDQRAVAEESVVEASDGEHDQISISVLLRVEYM
jgi:hypothetical protein